MKCGWRRLATILGLLLSLVSQSGCARTRPAINSLRQMVPPVRWPSRESHADATKTPPHAEPSVAANVAIQKEKEPDSKSGISSLEAKAKSLSGSFGLRVPPREIRPDETGESLDFTEHDETESASGAASLHESDHSNSPLARLDAALTDDVRHAMSLPQHSVTSLEERARVDSLISRAKELLEVGQLDQARDVALAAQELCDAAQLEYSPDEDRPIDLVRRIEGQREATKLTREAVPEQESSADKNPPKDPQASPMATKQSDPVEVDPKEGLSRKPRSWSTLFRRDKKEAVPPPIDSEPVTQTSGQTPAKWSADAQPAGVVTVRSHQTDSHNAVVMANRSISLGPPESSTDSKGSASRALSPNTSDRDVSKVPGPPESDEPETEVDLGSPLVITGDSSVPPIPFDEEPVILPDLEIEEISPPPRTAAPTPVMDELRSELTELSETPQQLDWTLVYVAVGMCGVLAVAGYRRGTT